MKRIVLCIFSLLLLLLVFFTLISPKAEEEMLTLVEEKKGSADNYRSFKIYNISYQWEHTEDTVFVISEGSGWESGLRLSQLPPEFYDVAVGHITLGVGEAVWYVRSASRVPTLGSQVRIVEPWRGEDSYLIWYPGPITDLRALPNAMAVTARAEDAILVSAQAAVFPYFEHNLWFRFKDSIGEDVRVYSLHDLQQFTEALPWIAGVAVCLLCSLLLWGASWLLSRREGVGMGLWIVNSLLIAALLFAVPSLLGRFDLPASLMPPDYILDLSHYRESFGRVLTALDAMGVSTVRDWLSQAGRTCALVLGSGLLAVGLILALERRLLSRP